MNIKPSIFVIKNAPPLKQFRLLGWILISLARLVSPPRAGVRHRYTWVINLCAAIFLLPTFSSGAVAEQNRTVRVGVYQNEPKIFMDKDGRASGIFIELLEEIAVREGWTLDYVPCEWAACLQELKDGQIDLMPDVAYSQERDAIYDFHKTPALESWSRVYSSSKTPINKNSDLDGKRVAVLQGSIQQTVFQQLMDGFGYKVILVPANSYEEAFKLAGNGSANAAIANTFFGDYFYQQYGLLKTTIDFQPVDLYYATAKGRNHDLLEAIDRHLQEWIPEPNSPYHTTLSHWTEKPPAYRIPQYIDWVIGGILGLLGFMAGTTLLLRRQVKARTQHLEQTSAELRKSEERYHTLARISPDGIFRTDPNGATTYVNPKWCEISGLSANEALGDGWLEAVHPDDKENLSKGWKESAQLHKPAFSDYRFVRPDGTIAWVMGQAVPEMNSENQIVGYVGTITDITERKQTENEIHKHINQLKALNKAALQLQRLQPPQILANEIIKSLEMIWDHSYGSVLLIDESGKRLLPFALSAQGQDDEFAARDKKHIESLDIRVGKGITGWVAQTGMNICLGDIRQDMRYYGVHENILSELCVPLKIGNQIIGVINVETDQPDAYSQTDESVLETVAAQVSIAIQNAQLHDKIQQYAAELEERVAQRTEELNAALLKAQAADRLKSTFLATMSHELRTPLNSIIGFTGVLMQGLAGPLNAEETKQLGMIRDSSRHLLTLINDVLDISKIEAGQLEVANTTFDMRTVIEDTLRAVSPQAQKKGLTLTAAIASNVGVVVNDRRRVGQILLNLLSNAIKFTEQGEVQLECQAQEEWLEISVRDSGIGIRPEDLDKLFQPFHQLETGLNRRHEGTGLGLAICKNFVNLLGGQIRVESKWGVGSTFTFTLPMATEGGSHGKLSDH